MAQLEYPTKMRLLRAAIATVVVLATTGVAIAIFSTPPPETSCERYGVSSFSIQEHWFSVDNPLRTEKPNADAAFRLEGWCTQVPSADTSCQCNLTLKMLKFEGDSSLPWGQPVTAEFWLADQSGPYTRIDTFILDPEVDISAENIHVFEGSKMWLTFDPTVVANLNGFRCAEGGLCIIEDVDGTDDLGLASK
jgi:hypothetical protein